MPGVFAAGDVRAESVKRVASAVGEGAMAVTLVHRYLEAMTDGPRPPSGPADARRAARRCSCSRRSTTSSCDWLAEHGARRAACRPAPSCTPRVSPADLLLRAAVAARSRMSRRVRGDEVEISRTDQRGVVRRRGPGVLGRPGRRRSTATASGRSPTRSFFVLPAEDVRRRSCGPGSRWRSTCWRGCSSACATARPIVGERERLLALGSLSAGLTHELNNPAAAAVRATAALRDRVAGMRHKLAMLADGRLDGERAARRSSSCRRRRSTGSADRAEAVRDGHRATPRTRSADWLEDHEVTRRRGTWRRCWSRRRARRGLAGAGRRPPSAPPTWSRRCAG